MEEARVCPRAAWCWKARHVGMHSIPIVKVAYCIAYSCDAVSYEVHWIRESRLYPFSSSSTDSVAVERMSAEADRW